VFCFLVFQNSISNQFLKTVFKNKIKKYLLGNPIFENYFGEEKMKKNCLVQLFL
jgi:hypothetical protein